MSQKHVLYIIFGIFSGFIASFEINAQSYPKYDLRGNLTENYSSQGIKFSISSDKSRYYTSESILINCNIKNDGTYPITLYMNNDVFKNFTFVIRNSKGQSLPLNNMILKNRPDKEEKYFFGSYTATNFNSRAIVLQPGESISKTFDFKNLINLEMPENQAENFSIMAYFYPNPDQSVAYYIPSTNEYLIHLDILGNMNQNLLANQNVLPVQELKVSPREVIYLMLTAEYEKNWINFFKYVDLHEIIRDYPDFARSYMRASREYKGLVIEDFKKYLMSNSSHKLIQFEVVDQKIDDNNAIVNVRAMREIDGFDRDFMYIYHLSAKGSLWQVSGVETQLIK